MRNFCITFDVDLTDYLSGKSSDEMDVSFDSIRSKLLEYPDVKTTWFIRIDKQIQDVYGRADYIFVKHQDKVKWLSDNGHEIGWHYHAYKLDGDRWVQNIDEEVILSEINRYGEIARGLGLRISRMGWGYHTNRTLQMTFSKGFLIDSSAIPRPKYTWETIVRDWSITPNHSYFPGQDDYRTDVGIKTGVLEVPINTAYLRLETDTDKVKRYINISYKHNYFRDAINDLVDLPIIVSVTHPYELIPNKVSHALLSFDIAELELNLQFLLEKQFTFKTMSSIYNKSF